MAHIPVFGVSEPREEGQGNIERLAPKLAQARTNDAPAIAMPVIDVTATVSIVPDARVQHGRTNTQVVPRSLLRPDDCSNLAIASIMLA